MLKKALFLFLCLVAASFGFGQTSVWNDPNIIVPKSSVPHAGRPNTHYVIYKGPRLRGTKIMPAGSLTKESVTPNAGPDGYWPSDIHSAYKITNNLGTNAIAIVIWFHNPDALTDFQTFSSQFGLPTETSSDPMASTNQHFQQVYAQGTQPQSDADSSGESSLDIEWSHAMAPNAKIYLVEATDSSTANLYGAIAVAHGLPKVKEISMSWGVPGEESDANALDQQYFNNTGVVYFASAGDLGGVQSYPATSAFVVSVGGTHLVLDSNKAIQAETAWSDSGGGPSSFVLRPSYQNPISSIVGGARGTPDISAVADPNTGVAVFSQFGAGGWTVFGGTSVSCPLSAGIANSRGQFSANPVAELSRIYTIYTGNKWKTLYHDITQGSAGSFSAATGWDFITGIGAPNGMYPNVASNTYTATNPQVIAGTEINSSPYNLASVLQLPYGQTAAMSTDFVLDKPVSAYASMTISVALTSQLRSTGQVFIYNPSTQKYEVVVSVPGTGAAATATKDVYSYLSTYTFSSGGQTILRFAYRGVEPARADSGIFSFKVSNPTLSASLTGN